MKEAPARHLQKDRLGLGGEAPGQRSPGVGVEGAAGLEEIGTVEYAAHSIPPGVPDRVIAYGVQDALIGLSFGSSPPRRSGTVPQVRGTVVVGRQPLELIGGHVAQRVMQPHRAEPAVLLVRLDPHRVRPVLDQCRDPLDVSPSLGRHDGPRGQRGPDQLSARSGGRTIRLRSSTNTTRGTWRRASAS